MKHITEYNRQYDYPVRIVQFGEGNFLRAFWGKAVDELNKKNIFKGQICVVQPIERGRLTEFKEQNYLYNVCLQSAGSEELALIESIKTGIDPYVDFNGFIELAKNSDVRILISNTTEAGIVLDEEDSFDNRPPSSFPGKVICFLYTRYCEYKGRPGSGLLIFPCELIENNGNELKRIIFELADRFNLGSEFKHWLEEENVFYNTLVDGIVTGYPGSETKMFKERLGYDDRMLVKGETYQLLVIEGDERFKDELPVSESALNVVWTQDLDYYRKIKVRIMNGFQTIMSLCGFLSGLKTEREALNHPVLGDFMKKGLYTEIVPSLPYSDEDKMAFSEKMLNRLNNPYIEHLLKDINLNSFSKFQSRIQPSIKYWESEDELLPFLMFSTAVLLSFYRIENVEDGAYYGNSCGIKYPVYDTPQNLRTLYEINIEADKNNFSTEKLCSRIFTEKKLWLHLPEFSTEKIKMISAFMDSIEENGILETISALQGRIE
jgi:tagaturonate reductase